ncbi:RloB family protein [Vibrio fluvialis]|nr:RloB family protein [Vibrio fluvialis]MBY7938574.1 RloB family protein [Vibrio fluvialis]
MPRDRKKKEKPVKPTLHIFCEGEKTEPYYLKSYIAEFHSSTRQLATILVEKTDKNTPVSLVKEAVAHKSSNGLKIDEYWVVYDREAVTKYPDALHLEARQKADANGINIALSNVCFEHWLLLHLEDHRRGYSSCADLLKNSTFKSLLDSHCGIKDYDKGLPFLFEKIKHGISDAVKRADTICKNAEKAAEVGKEAPHYLNPYTDVHKLLDAMKEFEEKVSKK